MRVIKHWRCFAAAALAAEFLLPWAATGHRIRSGYNLAGVLQQTHLVSNRFVGIIVVCVLLMPALAALTIAADLVDATRVATATLVVTALLVAVCVLAVGFARTGPKVAGATVILVPVLLVATRPRLRDVGAEARVAIVDGD